jgi:hypothetical protein
MTPHDARRTFITEALETGTPLANWLKIKTPPAIIGGIAAIIPP